MFASNQLSCIALIYIFVIRVHFAKTTKPNFCDEDYVDSVFNRLSIIEKSGAITNLITLTRGDWRWTYNSRTKSMSEPELMQSDSIEESGFHIYRLPDRTCTDNNCLEMKKLTGLAAVISLNKNTMQSNVQCYKVLNSQTIHNITDTREMPWASTASGYLADDNSNLWPKGWASNRRKPVAYISHSNHLSFIINGAQPVMVVLMLDVHAFGRSKVPLSDSSAQFHGMFELDGTVYAVGSQKLQQTGNKTQMKVFRYNTGSAQLVDTDKKLRSLFHCSNINDGNDNNSKLLIIGWILAIVLIVLIIAIVIVFVYWRRYKKKRKTVHKSESTGKVGSLQSMKSRGTINSETGLQIRSESSLTK